MPRSPRISRLGRALAATLLICVPGTALAQPPAPQKTTDSAAVKPLTWRDLVNRPDRWPAAAKITTTLRFQGAPPIEAGTVIHPLSVSASGARVILPAGDTTDVEPNETDLLAAANTYQSSLTPDQRAVTLQSVASDITILPQKVTVYTQLESNDHSEKVAPGSEVGVLKVLPNGRVNVATSKINMLLEAPYTDVLVRARTLRATPEINRPARILDLLAGTTVGPDGKPAEVKQARYYVFYFCSSSCPRCAVYTPKFVDRFTKTLAGRDDVAVVTLTADGKLDDALKYARDAKMPWPIVPWDARRPQLNEYHVPNMPGMAVVDRFGRVLATNNPGFPSPADAILDKLDATLKKTVQANPSGASLIAQASGDSQNRAASAIGPR